MVFIAVNLLFLLKIYYSRIYRGALMSDKNLEEYQKGYEEGKEDPRGFIQTIMEGIGEVVPLPKTKEYLSWKEGRDAGEAWRINHPKNDKKESNESYSNLSNEINSKSDYSYSSTISRNSLINGERFNLFIVFAVVIYFAIILSYYLLWFINPHPEVFLGHLIDNLAKLWSPTGDVVLNVVIDIFLVVIGVPILIALTIGILAVGVVLMIISGIIWLLFKLASLSVFGLFLSVLFVLVVLYFIVKIMFIK
jgi:hypothetical protein